MHRRSDSAFVAFAVLAIAFLMVPIILVVLFSFSSNAVAAFPFRGPTLGWYDRALSDPITTNALLASIKLALISAVLATILGAAAAYGVVRARPRLAATASTLLASPLFVPVLIVGIALATALQSIGMSMSLWTALLGHVVLELPLCFAIVAARLAGFDWMTESASRDLGASPLYTFTHVTLPAIAPALVGAWALGVAFSLDEFVVTFFTIGTDNTLPIVLWSRMRSTLDPSVNALATLIVVGSTALTAFALRFARVRV